MILRFHDLFVQILPISKPLATAESDSCDRGWQNPQEHTRSWRTNPLVYFLKLPLQPSTHLDFFNTQLNDISNRLIQFNKDVWFSLLLLNVRWLRRWWRWRNEKLLVSHNCFVHNLLCCYITSEEMLAYIYNRKRLVKKKVIWVDACWSCVDSC